MAEDPFPSNNPANDDAQVTKPSALPEDNGTPFQPADDIDDVVLGDAHQATDNTSDIDSDELYNEGLPAAADAAEPRDLGVVDYDPNADDEADK